ncbi:capsular biosynthesis protein [Roseibium denhamense]|uniref:Capsular polysaccharide export protein n=1 Tax=Roseibium denhamense TaxID=76305 RepID=A0ABY1NT76_9HYPH|nr:capsular biosynthesis protein [Roseibium denhamense]MTI08099.1 capsular biosynthesis protein [Roseibium denhamense]SMP16297.1 capsular polysaccharide export protein [Roseibium denhamense]
MSGGREDAPIDAGDLQDRRLLFLQGPLSPLFKLIGRDFASRGGEVHRINFCAGDWFHWHGPECTSYRGTPEKWPDFLAEFVDRNRITDLVLHGDQRLYHRLAIEKAIDRGVFIAVTELGALRPGWMTLEQNGLSTLSHFPVAPDAIKEIASAAGEIDLSPRYPGSFWLQTGPDVFYNLSNVLLKFLYPNYQQHTLYPPVLEYARGAMRLVSQARRDRVADMLLKQIQTGGRPYFVLPLQLEGDFQLRRHSPFGSFSEVLELVIASFAKAAPQDASLVIKSHPLDVGFENWPTVTEETAAGHGVAGRVHFLDGGGLGPVLEKAAGMVTVNSTAGVEALQMGVPVKTLVPAHFDIEGLTSRSPLGSFWQAPEPPDAQLLDNYIRALAASTQVRGSIHNREGVLVAARNMADRIASRELNSYGGYVDPPPRLARARELGVPL